MSRAAFVFILSGVAWASPSPAPCPSEQLESELLKAKKTVAAVKAEADSLERLSSGADDACRVRLFQRYWKFYASVQEAMAPPDFDEKRAQQIAKRIKPLGWVLEGSEGGNFVKDGSDWLVRRAGPRLPPDWRAYLAGDIQDTREGFQDDGGLTISWTAVRLRIRRWEDFLTAYPTFSETDAVKKRLRFYLISFLGGLDNTQDFDPESRKWYPEVRREFEAYLADKKAHDRKLVRGYYEILKKNGFVYTDAIEKYREENKLRFGD